MRKPDKTKVVPGPRRRRSDSGFSLVEALVTVVLVSIIIGAATAAFVQNQRITTSEIMRANLRSNLRFAVNVMAGDLRPVGSYSKWTQVYGKGHTFAPIECTNSQFQNWGNTGVNFGQYLGYDSSQPDRLRIIEPDIINDARLYSDYKGPEKNIQAVKITGQPFSKGDLLIITDANLLENAFEPGAVTHTALFVATGIQPDQSNNAFTIVTCNTGSDDGGINDTGGLPYSFPSGSALYKVRLWEYYIDQSNPAIPRLYRREVKGTAPPPELVAEYVEDFQVALWLDLDSDGVIDAGEWKNTDFAALTADPSQVRLLRAMRLTLTGRTPTVVDQSMAGSKLGTGDVYYQRPAVEDRAAGASVGTVSGAAYYREVYQEIIYLRNLQPPI